MIIERYTMIFTFIGFEDSTLDTQSCKRLRKNLENLRVKCLKFSRKKTFAPHHLKFSVQQYCMICYLYLHCCRKQNKTTTCTCIQSPEKKSWITQGISNMVKEDRAIARWAVDECVPVTVSNPSTSLSPDNPLHRTESSPEQWQEDFMFSVKGTCYISSRIAQG